MQLRTVTDRKELALGQEGYAILTAIAMLNPEKYEVNHFSCKAQITMKEEVQEDGSLLVIKSAWKTGNALAFGTKKCIDKVKNKWEYGSDIKLNDVHCGNIAITEGGEIVKFEDAKATTKKASTKLNLSWAK